MKRLLEQCKASLCVLGKSKAAVWCNVTKSSVLM